MLINVLTKLFSKKKCCCKKGNVIKIKSLSYEDLKKTISELKAGRTLITKASERLNVNPELSEVNDLIDLLTDNLKLKLEIKKK